MAEAVYIKGLDELVQKIDNLTDLKKLTPALKAGAEHIEGVVKVYPPMSEANMPGGPGSRWYERGSGPRYMRADGSIWRPKKDTSETLGRKWTVRSKNHGLTQIIGNNVSYGEFVHGERQAKFHEERGWKTIEDVVKSETETVLNFVKRKVDRILGG